MFGLILIVVLAFTAALFLDHKSEEQVYSFCTSYSVGNYIKDIEKDANEKQNELSTQDANTLLFEEKMLSPFLISVACEIKHANGRVSELNFIKR